MADPLICTSIQAAVAERLASTTVGVLAKPDTLLSTDRIS